MRAPVAAASALFAILLAPLRGPDPRYVKDFEFLVDAVRKEAAAIKTKGIDWDDAVKTFRPRFEKCASDAEHVKNVMELLATLRDSHTGVLDHKVKGESLPGKFDGLFGGGLWFGWDQGKFVLRGIMAGHPLGTSAPLGSVLLAVGGEPAWLAMERERRRVARFLGLSSDHSFFASLGNRLLPFGDRQELEIELLLPDRKKKTVTVPRWGPGGKAFYPGEAFLPEGIKRAEGAVAGMIAAPPIKKAAYACITGSMDDATAKAFHAALDGVKAADALILDCRTMGGGSDAAAWEMNGRFFPKGADNGRHGKIEPSGGWQFAGPVVVLQGELDVSSAETFLWAMSETGRAVTVGRATGGWGIIPKRFELPSGLAAIRIGVNDRPTPIKGAHTEGVGWPPDVLVPFGPEITALGDPAQQIGLDVLRVLAAGVPVDETRAAFRDLFAGNVAKFRAFAKKAGGTAKGVDLEKWAKLVLDDLKAELALETEALKVEGVVPDAAGASRRLPALAARAKAAGLSAPLAELEAALKAQKAEVAAQQALLDLADPFAPAADQKKAWLAKHGGTRTGKLVRERVWK
jgi:Peptidase family S41/Tricorn protease C1 domain